MSAIFISYRREDSEDSTRAIYESLRPRFGKERLFMDVEAIALGSDFRDAVERSLSNCGVFLAVIGPSWLNVKASNDPNAARRLDNPNDYVRQEVASALKKGKELPVIPVLVRGASMPTADQLPDDLKDLAYRNALTLNNLDWDSSVAKLINAILPHVGDPEALDLGTSQAARLQPAAVRASAPPGPTATAQASRTNKALLFGIPVVLVLAAVGAYFALRPKPTPAPVPTPQQTTLEARLVRNPSLKGLPGPVNVLIDGKQVGQIQSNPEGSTPLQFQVAPGDHNFKIVDPQRHSTCEGTFSVNASQTHFKPAITSGGTQCVLDPVFQN